MGGAAQTAQVSVIDAFVYQFGVICSFLVFIVAWSRGILGGQVVNGQVLLHLGADVVVVVHVGGYVVRDGLQVQFRLLGWFFCCYDNLVFKVNKKVRFFRTSHSQSTQNESFSAY